MKSLTKKRSADEWRAELRGKTPAVANDIIVSDGTDEAYEAFVSLYETTPFGKQARQWLDRQRRMVAWKNASLSNSAAGYRDFLATYPDSDLTSTARKLEERLRNRPLPLGAAAPTNVALAPTCPCNPGVIPPGQKKAAAPRRAEQAVPKPAAIRPPRSRPGPPPDDYDDDDVVIYRRGPVYGPPPGVYIGRGGYGGGSLGNTGGSRGGYR